jgi:hypothetical protein
MGYYKAPKPLPPFKYKVKGGAKVVDTYGEVVAAWRVGTVYDFYYGSKSDTDPTVVWLVDGTEYAKGDLAGVKAQVAEGFKRAGVVSVTVGPTWCGYPSLTVEYESGITVTEAYDGTKVTIESTPATALVAVAA